MLRFAQFPSGPGSLNFHQVSELGSSDWRYDALLMLAQLRGSTVMLSAEKFVDCWGKADLFPFPPDLLHNIDLPDDSKAFLMNAGVPIVTFVGWLQAILLPRKPLPGVQYKLLEVCPSFAPDPWLLPARLLTTINGWPLHLAIEEDSGKILMVGLEVPAWANCAREVRYLVSSSVFQFAESLLVNREFMIYSDPWISSTERHPDDEYGNHYRRVDTLEHRLREIDPAAMSEPVNWWSRHISGLRHP